MIYQDASGKAYMKFIGPRKSTAHLENLKKFSTYTITVSAVTDGGLREKSEPVTLTTQEDGKFLEGSGCLRIELRSKLKELN